MTDNLNDAAKSGYAIVRIDLHDGSSVTIATPPQRIARFEKTIREIIEVQNNEKPAKKKRKQKPVPTNFVYRSDDPVWTVTAHGFGVSREILSEKVDQDLLDEAIQNGDLVVDGSGEDGSDWIRLPDAFEKEQEVFERLLEKARQTTLYRSAAGGIVRRLYPEHYSREFLDVVMDAASDPDDGVFDVEESVKNGTSNPIYHIRE